MSEWERRRDRPKEPRSSYRYGVERLKWKNQDEETNELKWTLCQSGRARFVFKRDAEEFLEAYADGVGRAVHEGDVPRTFALRLVKLARNGEPKEVLHTRALWRRTKTPNSTSMLVTEPGAVSTIHLNQEGNHEDPNRSERDGGAADDGVRDDERGKPDLRRCR